MNGKKLPADPSTFYYLGAGGIFAVILAGLLLYTDFDPLHSYFAAINSAAFFLFAFDKSISASNSLRVPESVIFTLALVGGAIGILAAMKIFRHKIRKAGFQLVLALIIIVQLFLLQYFTGS